ncbi:MAG: hypothetical protein N3D84_00830 [Candidatus Woesearchaeota archaeon]|nr:hypothetical protein [Candidatus Woesearchaeota archaeon]
MPEKRGLARALFLKSQAAMEYLMIAGIAFVIVVPMVYILYSYTTSMSQEVAESKVGKIANDIVNTAEQIYYLGEPSRTTLTFNMPEGVYDIEVQGDRSIVFKLGDVYNSKEVVAVSSVDIASFLIPDDFKKGRKKFRIEAERDYVDLYTGDKETAMLKSAAYRIFKQFMNKAGLLVKEEPLISYLGDSYGINERTEEDIAFINATMTEVDISADIVVREIKGSIEFKVENGENYISIELNSNPQNQSKGFFLLSSSSSSSNLEVRDSEFIIGEKYTFNITKSGDQYYIIIYDKSGDVKISAYINKDNINLDGITPPKWFFGEKSNTENMISASIKPNTEHLSDLQTHFMPSQTISLNVKMPLEFYLINITSDNKLFFGISAVDAAGNPRNVDVSFNSYYPVLKGQSFEGPYNIDKEYTFSFTKSAEGIVVDKVS